MSDRTRLDEAVLRVARSLETQFRVKVGLVQLTAPYADFPVGCCTTLGDSNGGDAALRAFFLDLANNAVAGLQDMLLDETQCSRPGCEEPPRRDSRCRAHLPEEG